MISPPETTFPSIFELSPIMISLKASTFPKIWQSLPIFRMPLTSRFSCTIVPEGILRSPSTVTLLSTWETSPKTSPGNPIFLSNSNTETWGGLVAALEIISFFFRILESFFVAIDSGSSGLLSTIFSSILCMFS